MTLEIVAPWPARSAAASLLSIMLLVLVSPTAAQQPIGPNLATRQQLQDALTRLPRDRDAGAALLRARLANGDFQPGDRILVRVDGEQALSDTFTVAPGPMLILPQVGAVPLGGVLRSELSGRVAAYLAHYIRDPVIQVRSLIRLLVDGDVAKPGYYAVPPELPLADALTAAGGLTQGARVTRMRVERDGTEIWDGARLQLALGRGYSIDQLNLQAGDRVFVPARGGGMSAWQVVGLLATVPAAVLTIVEIGRVH
jgi:protein involved in polysaccharide export with SLBB domain